MLNKSDLLFRQAVLPPLIVLLVESVAAAAGAFRLELGL